MICNRPPDNAPHIRARCNGRWNIGAQTDLRKRSVLTAGGFVGRNGRVLPSPKDANDFFMSYIGVPAVDLV